MAKLLTLPKKDILEITSEDKLEIKCEFCEKVYTYDKDDIAVLLSYVEDR